MNEPRVIEVGPGDAIEITGAAGPDGILLDFSWEESGDRLILQGPGAFVRFRAIVELQDRGGRRRGARDWLRWWFLGEEGARS